jgi:rod shape-determining protein MreD
MIRELTRNISNFIFLILIQVLILNHIEFSGFVNPYLYVLFILLLPFETPRWLQLISSFFLGLAIDMFMQTWGLHTFASVFIGYIRPYLLKIVAPRDGYEAGTLPGIKHFGFEWFMKYSVIIVLSHHLVLFYLEAFKFHQFFSTLLRALLSSVFTLILIMLSQFLIQKR